MTGSLIVIYGIIFFSVVTGIVFLYQVRNIREAADTRSGELDWICELLKRAGEQIQSEDEDTILAGLQTIAQYRAPEARAKFFGRIEELSRSNLPNVARQANWTKDAIIRQAIFSKTNKKAQMLKEDFPNGA